MSDDDEASEPKLTDEELTLYFRAEGWGFDMKDAAARFRRAQAEPWQALFWTQLYIDHILSDFLKLYLRNPKEIPWERVYLSDKVRWLRALGLITSEHKSALLTLNKLRSALVHRLDFKVDKDVMMQLRNAVPKQQRKRLSRRLGMSKRSEIQWHVVLFDLVLHTDKVRMCRMSAVLDDRMQRRQGNGGVDPIDERTERDLKRKYDLLDKVYKEARDRKSKVAAPDEDAGA